MKKIIYIYIYIYMGLVNGKWYAKTICTLGVHVLGGLIWQQDS